MRNCIGIITIYGGLKNIYGIYMSYLWHLDELSMALRLAIYGIFAHGLLSKFAEGMRRSRINVKKSRQNYDC